MKNNKILSITRSDICDTIYREIGLPFSESMAILDTMIEEITDAFVRGENVKISSFGTFSVKMKPERIGRNPKTGVKAIIAPRRAISFKASYALKNKVETASKKG